MAGRGGVVVVADPNWEQDKQWFVSRVSGVSARQRGVQAADDRASLWSPLARQFAAIGRDLYATPALAEIFRQVLSMTLRTVPGVAWANVSLRRIGEPLHTVAWTDAVALPVDELQQHHQQGPVFAATVPDGTGMSMSADLAHEVSWPEFGPRAAEHGARSVVSVGVFPGDERRAGTLSAYASEPRGLAAVDPDVLLILASFTAAALRDVDAVAEQDLRAAEVATPLASNWAAERATRFLMERRHLDAGEAYDILRRASGDLLDSWHGA